MGTLKKEVPERTQFYAQAIHVLFAIVLGQSFMLASDILIPFQSILKPDNHTTVMALIFVYILIVSGWAGYTKSILNQPHKDTNLGTVRFIIDLIILFEYFYLLRISQTEHLNDLPIVVGIIFTTYIAWDFVKYREHSPKDGTYIGNRGKITVQFCILMWVVTLLYYTGRFEIIALEVGWPAYNVVVIVFGILIVAYRVNKWDQIIRYRQ